jgi:hypothetical protein
MKRVSFDERLIFIALLQPDEGYYVPDEGYYVPDEGYYVPDEGYSRNM